MNKIKTATLILVLTLTGCASYNPSVDLLSMYIPPGTVPYERGTPEYDAFVRDTVNFLAWAATPEKLQRQRLGYWVIIFLVVFLLFAYLLKKEIWNDIK